MAVEIFLKLAGVEGECPTKGFEKQIQVYSYSLGASNPSSVGTGSGSGAGKVDLSSLSIQKELDFASAKLFLTCCNGKHFDDGTMVLREAGGDTPVEYLTVVFKQVFVDSISWGGAQGGGKPSESVSLSFAEAKFTYFTQDEKGAKKDKAEAGWNVKTNAPV